MPELITSSSSFNYAKNKTPVGSSVGGGWLKGITIHNNTVASYQPFGDHITGVVSTIYMGKGIEKDAITKYPWGGIMSNKDASTDTLYSNILPYKDVSFNFGELLKTSSKDLVINEPYFNLLPYKDVGTVNEYVHVYTLDNRPIPDTSDVRYTPTLSFEFDESEYMSFNGNFIKPIDYDKLKIRMSPVDVVTEYPWGRTRIVDIYQDLKWGFGINDFIIGGVNTDYLVDEDALVSTSPDTPETQRVIRFVNIVNIVTLPARTPIAFTDFQLSYDVESLAWNFSMNVPSKNVANLVKPTLLSVVELEVSINGSIFLVFVSKTNTTNITDENGKITRRIKCSGYSVHKLLSYPYSPKSSFTEASTSTPAGILNAELIGSGFTGTWSCPSWTIPANTYSYVDKSKLAGILELVNAIGGVVVPDPSSKSFTIKPRYPLSPWVWGINPAEEALNENNFFSIDTEWIPQESPDSIYVFGDDDNGVAVKCVITGTGGVKTLPSVTNKYMTDTIPAAERGRIEVAKNGFIEAVPISTYVDPVQGILQPLTLVEVTESDGGTWKGLVVAVALTLKRNGNALVQTLTLERHYDAI